MTTRCHGGHGGRIWRGWWKVCPKKWQGLSWRWNMMEAAMFLPGVLKRVPGFGQHMVAWRNDLTSGIIPLGDFDGTFREVKHPLFAAGYRRRSTLGLRWAAVLFSARPGVTRSWSAHGRKSSLRWAGWWSAPFTYYCLKKRISQSSLMTRGCWPRPWPFSTRKKTTPKVPPARGFLHSRHCRPVAHPSATSPLPRQNISRVSLWWRWTPPRRTASVNRRDLHAESWGPHEAMDLAPRHL